MSIIYSPLLLITAYLEARAGRQVLKNRSKNEEDADTTEEWEELGPLTPGNIDRPQENGDSERRQFVDFEADGWAKTVEMTKPNVEVDSTLLEVRELQKQVRELAEMVKSRKDEKS